MRPYVTPRALETEELPGVVLQYSNGAQRAKIAGRDTEIQKYGTVTNRPISLDQKVRLTSVD
ncbi:MAG: hypothetical protein WBL61_07465 [Bryobacteraceae bacterium]